MKSAYRTAPLLTYMITTWKEVGMKYVPYILFYGQFLIVSIILYTFCAASSTFPFKFMHPFVLVSSIICCMALETNSIFELNNI